MSTKTKSGSIRCDDERVSYTWDGGSWTLRFVDITVIGECTNELGPFADDYYICFVAADGETWWTTSFYAEGRDELLQCLARRFGSTFEWGLCDSTTFKSRVMWPPPLRDKPLFAFSEPRASNRFSGFLRALGIAPSSNVQTVSSEVREFVLQRGG
jgi:hypothetical protein